MNKRLIIGVIAIIVTSGLFMGYLKSINGTIVDADTGRPIEGAAVLVEWTKTKGLGLTYTEAYKVVEEVTDKEGRFSVFGGFSPFVDPSLITIYKKGYVAWNSEYIFPGFRKREDLTESGHVFKMERFISSYSYDAHVTFINTVIRSTIAYEKKKKLINAFDWETDLARNETKKKVKQGGCNEKNY